jgi:hypothetical protein
MGRREETSSKWKGDRKHLQNGKAIGEIFKMERRYEKSSKWKGDRRNLQNGKAIGDIFTMQRHCSNIFPLLLLRELCNLVKTNLKMERQ